MSVPPNLTAEEDVYLGDIVVGRPRDGTTAVI